MGGNMYIGIDIGGTNIAAAIVDENGNILKRAGTPVNAGGGAKAIVADLLSLCEILLADTEEAPVSIGIGVPGTVKDDDGEIVFTPNLPLNGENITHELKEKYGCPVRLGNDANCAAIGESVAGGAKGVKSVVFITLGTGIGGGVILDGQIYTGQRKAGCEIGHMTIHAGGRKCGCGRLGCWEAYASATGLATTAREVLRDHKDSMIWELSGGNTAKIDGKLIFEAHKAGDTAARLTVELYISHLAAGIISIINMMDPEMICIGGGISNAWDMISEPLRSLVEAEDYYRYIRDLPRTKIVKAELGNDAGIIGAAMLGRELAVNNNAQKNNN